MVLRGHVCMLTSHCAYVHACVCGGALCCPHYHMQTRVENQHVGHLLVKFVTHCHFFTDSGQKRKLSYVIIGRNRTLLAVPAGMWKRRDKIHISLLNQRHFLRSEEKESFSFRKSANKTGVWGRLRRGGKWWDKIWWKIRNWGEKCSKDADVCACVRVCMRACVWEGSEWFIGQLCAVF